MIRYEPIDDDDGLDPEPCEECGADEAQLYEDRRSGGEVWLCDACAGDDEGDDECPMCHADSATVKIAGVNQLRVCESCADAEEGA